MLETGQWIIFGTLILTLFLFISGKPRYDLVALTALLIVVISGLIPINNAFLGFGNPVVITVATVFILSRALQNSGVVDVIGQRLSKLEGGVTLQLAALPALFSHPLDINLTPL